MASKRGVKCSVNFRKGCFIYHEKFLGKWSVIFFDEEECDDVTKCITERSCDNRWDKKEWCTRDEVPTNHIEEL